MENKSEAETRLEKLEQLKKLGVDPYPAEIPSFITIDEARAKKEGAKVATVGRIAGLRKHGKLAFLDVEDESHKIQLLAKSDLTKGFDRFDLFDQGDYVWVAGELFTTKAGELTIQTEEIVMLAKSLLPIPEHWHGLTDVETRYRSRALDFKINDEARQIVKDRAKVVEIIRNFFSRHGFLEVQTPILQPIPGGGAAKPFVTRYNALDAEFYLRIAPELYLKRLVAGGFNRVFEIGPNFRNEGFSHMHNPEFYTCEAYWAYQDYQGFMQATQELVQEVVKKVCGSLQVEYQDQKLDFAGDFAVKKYVDLIKDDSGIDIEKEDTFEKLNAALKAKKITFEGQKIKVWAEQVDELFKKVSRPKIIRPTFVIDYPISLQPLAKRHRSNPALAEQFQLIAGGGFELVKAYTELNDPQDQEERFREQLKFAEAGWDEAQALDENFIEALKLGMPPTAGWGMGIERLTMLLTNQHSIKEVIPFPTLRPQK